VGFGLQAGWASGPESEARSLEPEFTRACPKRDAFVKADCHLKRVHAGDDMDADIIPIDAFIRMRRARDGRFLR